jgi:hypothetical protein
MLVSAGEGGEAVMGGELVVFGSVEETRSVRIETVFQDHALR